MADVDYSPAFAPHVKGRYTARVWDPGTARHEPQTWSATCAKCKDTYGPTQCDSGRVRQKIDTWALNHLHRDPMTPRPVVKLPGGGR